MFEKVVFQCRCQRIKISHITATGTATASGSSDVAVVEAAAACRLRHYWLCTCHPVCMTVRLCSILQLHVTWCCESNAHVLGVPLATLARATPSQHTNPE